MVCFIGLITTKTTEPEKLLYVLYVLYVLYEEIITDLV
jgi:hypothetical protein